jgi:hypothetical protein
MSFDRVLISVASRTLLSLAILILLALGGMLSPQQTPSLGVLGQTCESFGGEPGECQAWVSNSSLVFFPVSQPASVASAQAYLSACLRFFFAHLSIVFLFFIFIYIYYVQSIYKIK